ncbi:MAG TPA: GNAT family N-acetyltransferase [Candidatus Acidoferrum sp.]|nr:GNAT family N-acetyltransferase [Candidatus Acidoferrum sp.]
MNEPPNIRVRLATLADVAQLTPMRHELWPESPASHHSAELTAVLSGGSQRVYPLVIFVAQDDSGTLVGFLEANLRSAADGCDEKLPVGYVEGWFVAESRRGQGVGAALLRDAEDWARAQGCVEMASDTAIDNHLSQRVHEASGFTVSARSVLYRKSI